MKQNARNESTVLPTNWFMLNVDLPHYKALKKRMRINLDQFSLLSKIEIFQSRTGWCEPRIKNTRYYLTPLLHDIGENLGIEEKTTDAMIKTLINKSLLEKSPCKKKIRVTLLFAANYQEDEVNDTKPNTAQPSPVVKTTRQKKEKPVQAGFMGFGEVPIFKSVETFKAELKTLLPNLPLNVGYKFYFDGFTGYYADKKSVASLETWQQRVKDYLNKAIKNDILKDENGVKINLLGGNTEGVVLTSETNETILNDVQRLGKMVSYPTEETKYKVYKDMTLNYINAVNEAEKRGLLATHESGTKWIKYKNELQTRVQTAGELAIFMKERLQSTKKGAT